MIKILLIEDESQLSDNIQELLELSGYAVQATDSAEAGVELLLQQPFDLILCDVSLPVREGYYVLEELMKTEHIVPFIFLSARVDLQSIRKGLTLGADDYVMKPFESHVMLNAVRAQLAKYQRIRQVLSKS